MKYADFALEDFLEDRNFQEWINKPTPASNQFWAEFMRKHPEKAETIRYAKDLLLSIHYDMNENSPNNEQVRNMWEKIKVGVHDSVPENKGTWLRLSWLSAAAAIIIMTTTFCLVKHGSRKMDITYAQLVTNTEVALIERKNLTDKAITINLPDSSKVTLEPQSYISFSPDFNTKREIYLSGQAFFDVKRDVNKPFFVYANELVTKVLGTSFTVKALENAPQMEVLVKTGRVAVFTRDKTTDISESHKQTIVTPNHRVLYSRQEECMQKFLVEAPEVIATTTAPAPASVEFQDTPVTEIFKSIEDAYGIDLVYDPDLFKNCLLTASFTQESLYDKIELICKGVEAQFNVKNTQIIISGRGCI